MDTKIRQTVQEKVDYCRCAQVNVIQKVRSVFRVKKYSGTEGKLDVKEPIYKYILPQDINPPPATALLEQTCWSPVPTSGAMNVFLNK